MGAGAMETLGRRLGFRLGGIERLNASSWSRRWGHSVVMALMGEGINNEQP